MREGKTEKRVRAHEMVRQRVLSCHLMQSPTTAESMHLQRERREQAGSCSRVALVFHL